MKKFFKGLLVGYEQMVLDQVNNYYNYNQNR